MRLIDVDAAIREATQEGAYGYISVEELNNLPIIEERKAGIWRRKLSTHFGLKLNDIIICSVCETAFSSENMIRRAYCPQCGARMLETKGGMR